MHFRTKPPPSKSVSGTPFAQCSSETVSLPTAVGLDVKRRFSEGRDCLDLSRRRADDALRPPRLLSADVLSLEPRRKGGKSVKR